MSTLLLLSKRYARGVERLEELVYPEQFQLGGDLLTDVDFSLSCVVVNQKQVVGYLLTEWLTDDSVYVSDIVRTRESTISGTEMLFWLLGRLAERPEAKYLSAECRTTSVKFIEEFGLEVVAREEEFCSWRRERMTSVKVKLPAR